MFPSLREHLLALEVVLCMLASCILVEAVVELTHRGYTCLQSLQSDSSIVFKFGPAIVRIETILVFCVLLFPIIFHLPSAGEHIQQGRKSPFAINSRLRRRRSWDKWF